MSMMQTYKNITKRVGNESEIKGCSFKVMIDCENDYYKELLPTIPAGTELIADFAGDFGIYGMAEVKGALHKVKIKLHELHHIDFAEFDARNLHAAEEASAA